MNFAFAQNGVDASKSISFSLPTMQVINIKGNMLAANDIIYVSKCKIVVLESLEEK